MVTRKAENKLKKQAECALRLLLVIQDPAMAV